MNIKFFKWILIIFLVSFSGVAQEKNSENDDDKGSELSVFVGGIS